MTAKLAVRPLRPFPVLANHLLRLGGLTFEMIRLGLFIVLLRLVGLTAHLAFRLPHRLGGAVGAGPGDQQGDHEEENDGFLEHGTRCFHPQT